MAHYCICAKCNQKFDRDKVITVQVSGRRYGHAACFPDITDLIIPEEGVKVRKPKAAPPPEDDDLIALKAYISEIYGTKANWPLISKQIKTFVKEKKFTYVGMLKTLKYFYEINKNSVEKSNGGIGIIEYVYWESYQYYYKISVAQQHNENKVLVTKVKEYVIPAPQKRGTNNKILDWGEDGDYEEQ